VLNLDYATLTILGILANTSIQAGLLMLLIGFLLWAFRVKSAAVRYYFWLIALLGTALLPLVGAHVPSFSFHIKRSETIVVGEPVEQTNTTMPAKIMPRAAVVENTSGPANPSAFNVETLPAESEKATAGNLTQFNLFFIIALLWLLGVSFMLFRLGKGYIDMRRLVVTSERVDSERLSQLKDKLNIKRKVELFTAVDLYCPVSFGLFSPKIFLPRDTDLSEIELDMVLGHELAHIKRWDCLVNLLQRILEAIFFFHPLIIFASRRLTSLREHICDDYVIEMTKNRISYAQCLTRLFERARDVPLPMFAKMAGQFPQVRRRVMMILDDTRKLATHLSPKTMFTVLLIGCLSILLAGMAKVILLPEEKAQAKESPTTDDTTKVTKTPMGDYGVILHAFASRPKDVEEIVRLVSERIRGGIQSMHMQGNALILEGILSPRSSIDLSKLVSDVALLAKLKEDNPGMEFEHLATYRFNMKAGKRNRLSNIMPRKLYRWLGLQRRESRLGYLHLWHPEFDKEALIGLAADFEGGKLRARGTANAVRGGGLGMFFNPGKFAVIAIDGGMDGMTVTGIGGLWEISLPVGTFKILNSRATQDFMPMPKDLPEIFYILVIVPPQADADFVPPGETLSLTGMPPVEGEILTARTPVQRNSPKAHFGILNLQNLFTHSHTGFTGQPPGVFWDMSNWWFDKPQITHNGVPFHIHQGDLDIVVPGKMPEALRGEEKLHLRMAHINSKAKRLHLLLSVPLVLAGNSAYSVHNVPIPFTIHYADGTQSIVWACVSDPYWRLTTTSFVPIRGAPNTFLCHHETLEIPHPERTIQAIEGHGHFMLIAATLEL